MLKVIIADDERKVCQLIRKLVEWEKLGFEVIGIAQNGPDAYDLIRDFKPDVVITDIRMPGMDGTELIRRTKEQGISSSFIIISGYRHFEYAHSALKYGVENYLLKPINKQELIETLKKISRQSIEENVQIENELRMKNELVENRNKIRKHFLNSVIFDVHNENELKIENINHEYQLHFQTGIFQAILIKLDHRTGFEESIEKVLNKLTELTEKRLSDRCFEYVISLNRSNIICIINYSNEDTGTVDELWELLFNELKNYVEMFGCFNLTMGIGTAKNSIKDVSASILSAIDAIRCRIILGLDRIIRYDYLNYEHPPMFEILTNEKRRQLGNILETMDKHSYEQWNIQMLEAVHSIKNYDPCIIFEIFEAAKEIILQTLKEVGMKNEDQKSLREHFDIIFDNGISENIIVENLQTFMGQQLDRLLQVKRLIDSRPIRLAKQFVLEHYREPLSLEEVADAIYLNASYLSAVFKKEVGINFSDYLINCRIDAAKDLLKNSHASILEIAEKVGYTDTKYFSKLFSKVVGIKPSEYRKLYAKV
jgi:two-component system, response regulator YesN